ncbi:hypothetical protein E2E30_10120 [Sphingomonas sp. AAP5]|uniref:hypothetical protein n=1 Tax=Sphingomonas sp. AAP5 TaxID=1523415 RepID=UPI001056F9AC|nr:hypothetical protein [Sphingomonas sp. AAP5]QBM76082.1 hypothetical protein E2E30_10120 [Sphingomonas sp. AAP5]
MTLLIVGQPMSRAVLLDYAWQYLVPALQGGDIVRCLRVSSRKDTEIAQIIVDKGATSRFLLRYSSGLKPIEMAISKAKKPLRPLGPHRSPCRSVSARRVPKPASLCRRDADRVTSRYKNPFWLEGVRIITRIALVTCIYYLELLLTNQNMHMLLLITTNDQIHLFELYKFINRI